MDRGFINSGQGLGTVAGSRTTVSRPGDSFFPHSSSASTQSLCSSGPALRGHGRRRFSGQPSRPGTCNDSFSALPCQRYAPNDSGLDDRGLGEGADGFRWAAPGCPEVPNKSRLVVPRHRDTPDGFRLEVPETGKDRMTLVSLFSVSGKELLTFVWWFPVSGKQLTTLVWSFRHQDRPDDSRLDVPGRQEAPNESCLVVPCHREGPDDSRLVVPRHREGPKKSRLLVPGRREGPNDSRLVVPGEVISGDDSPPTGGDATQSQPSIHQQYAL